MRTRFLIALASLLSTGTLFAQGGIAEVLDLPRIDVMDYYGLHRVTPVLIQQALGVHEGDPIPASRLEAQERIIDINDVNEAELEAVCCEYGNILYVGLEERGSPHYNLRLSPGGPQLLPIDFVETYVAYQDAIRAALKNAAARGNNLETLPQDLSQGHGLTAEPKIRAYEERFLSFAKTDLDEIRDVLRNSGDDVHRMVAAFLIGYAEDKASVIPDLQYALRDGSSEVRANAAKSLTAFVVRARHHPESRLRIETGFLVDLFDSIAWKDRMQAVRSLEILTAEPDATLFTDIKIRAVPALAEMARWKTRAHARPAVFVLGRVVGLSLDEIQNAWLRGNKEAVIAAAQAAAEAAKASSPTRIQVK